MGVFDSSRTRVAPVFDRLMASDPTGRSWLPKLLALGSSSSEAAWPRGPGDLAPGHPHYWGTGEARLPAPASLLEWLVENVSPEAVDASDDKGETLKKRRLLARGDPDTVAEALRRLRAGERGRKWFVLEGESAPDALLETDRLILVVEGKRTEPTATTKTKWMPRRSQLLRHMDAAFEKANGRTVLGLLIVEGQQPNPLEVPVNWAAVCSETVSPDLLEASLPHRSPAEREQLRQGILGAATWQRVCQTFDLPWPPAEDG
jgi:hypothetical protein